jgi:hypothetical protein
VSTWKRRGPLLLRNHHRHGKEALVALPLDDYMTARASATPETTPFQEADQPDLSAAFVKLSLALSAFVQEARKEGSIGYANARYAQQMTDYLPKTEAPSAADRLHALAISLRNS